MIENPVQRLTELRAQVEKIREQLGDAGAALAGVEETIRELEAECAREDAAQVELTGSDERLRALFRAVIDPLVAIDTTGTVLAANPAVEKVFGWTPEELRGQNVNMLMEEPYRTEHDDYIANYLDTGVRRAIGKIRDVVGRRKKGESFPCQISISEIWENGERSFVGIVRDLTEREELSTKLAQTERLAAVGELAAGVAHEVNNPINTIMNCAQLILDGDDDTELLNDILHEGERISEIVRGLLDFAREKDEDFHPTDLAEVIARTTGLVRRRIEKAGIDLDINIPSDLPKVRGRFQQLEQVLLNLLMNGRDAIASQPSWGGDADRRPTIRLRAETRERKDEEPAVVLKVWDNGPGISPDVQTRIFEPFFTTKRGAGGTGLGLSITHGIVESHGGRISVRSELNKFTEFRMELPVANWD